MQRSLRVLDGGRGCFRCYTGRGTAERNSLATGGSLRCSPNLFYQQNGSRWCFPLKGSIDSIKERLAANPIPMQIPIGNEREFRGVVDLITMQATYWDDELGQEPITENIPAEMLEDARFKREQMIEQIAELDDDLILKYLEGEQISNEELKSGFAPGGNRQQSGPCFLWFFSQE